MAITTYLLNQIGFLRNNKLDFKKSSIGAPDFLGIGAQKSGTTWLYENLKKHPQIFLPETKEIHFFDRHFYKSIDWYYNHFLSRDISKTKGEITPSYSILPEKKIEFIYKMNPELKIILLLRNPIERTWSHAVMNLVKRTGKDIGEIKNKTFIDHFNNSRSTKRGDYLRIIKNWKKYFNMEQIFIGDYNQLKSHPEKLLNEIFNFLDVEQVTNWKEYPIKKTIGKGSYKNKTIPNEIEEYLSKMYSKDLKNLKKALPKIKW